MDLLRLNHNGNIYRILRTPGGDIILFDYLENIIIKMMAGYCM